MVNINNKKSYKQLRKEEVQKFHKRFFEQNFFKTVGYDLRS